MSTGTRAARVAIGAAAIGALSAALASGAVVATQLASAKRRVGLDPASAPDLPSDAGSHRDPLIRLVVLGDSVATGVGARSVADLVGFRVSQALTRAGYHVQIRSVAIPNSTSGDVKIQASRALITSEEDPYDIALILVGTMDSCSWSRLEDVDRASYRAVRALHNAGVDVVLATTTDLGAATCVRQPLRGIWGWRSRRVAAAQRTGAEEAGATVIDLVEQLGSAVAADRTLLSEDGFHPSPGGYRAIAAAVIPTVLELAHARRARRTGTT